MGAINRENTRWNRIRCSSDFLLVQLLARITSIMKSKVFFALLWERFACGYFKVSGYSRIKMVESVGWVTSNSS
jgi:hypothetical protein